MLTHHRLPVSISLSAVDSNFLSTVETAATVYQKDKERFHILLSASTLPNWEPTPDPPEPVDLQVAMADTEPSPRLLWLEVSPYRLVMTMQGGGKLSYRHFWERGVYGVSRYWLQSDDLKGYESFRLRNYTRNLFIKGHPLPSHLRLDYEMWTESMCLGQYVLNLEIEH